jgi:hypothetical protein
MLLQDMFCEYLRDRLNGKGMHLPFSGRQSRPDLPLNALSKTPSYTCVSALEEMLAMSTRATLLATTVMGAPP